MYFKNTTVEGERLGGKRGDMESEQNGQKPQVMASQVERLLTSREVELINGMIEVQLRHANICDGLINRTMASKQKAWDMERVALLKRVLLVMG